MAATYLLLTILFFSGLGCTGGEAELTMQYVGAVLHETRELRKLHIYVLTSV